MRIAAPHLETWADTRNAQELLPILVRRLVSAKSKTTQLSMPAGDSVGAPGWDHHQGRDPDMVGPLHGLDPKRAFRSANFLHCEGRILMSAPRHRGLRLRELMWVN
jgi:hypothetical protein